MQCSAVQCSAVQCSGVQFSARQCRQCSAVQCSAVQRHIVPNESINMDMIKAHSFCGVHCSGKVNSHIIQRRRMNKAIAKLFKVWGKCGKLSECNTKRKFKS